MASEQQLDDTARIRRFIGLETSDLSEVMDVFRQIREAKDAIRKRFEEMEGIADLCAHYHTMTGSTLDPQIEASIRGRLACKLTPSQIDATVLLLNQEFGDLARKLVQEKKIKE